MPIRPLLTALLLAASLAHAQAAEAPAAPTPTEEPQVEFTDDNRIVYGPERRELTPVQLFEVMGRRDLVARAQLNATRRIVLAVSAGALAAAGVTVAIVMMLTTPPTVGATPCNAGNNDLYNTYCQPQYVLHYTVSTVSLVAGLAGAGILATYAVLANPDVYSAYQLERLIHTYNASRAGPASLRVLPWALPGGAGLVASARF